jgi:Fic family protein
MKLAGPDTKLVLGHGTIINRTDLIPDRDMVVAVQGEVQQMIAQGKTLQDVLAAKVTAPYDAKVHPFSDGNGRLSRIMMNAELVSAAEQRIIVLTSIGPIIWQR